MLDGMSDSIRGSRIENLHSTEVDHQSPTGLIFYDIVCASEVTTVWHYRNETAIIIIIIIIIISAEGVPKCPTIQNITLAKEVLFSFALIS